MPVSNKPLRLLSLFLLAGLLLAGCAPQARTVANSFMPQIFKARYADGQLHLQGRYLGHGSGGIDAGHYVLRGGDVDETGGLDYDATSWSYSREDGSVPADGPTGNVFVGSGGIDAGHYALLGADVDGTGGLAYEAMSWSDSRVTVSVPADAPTGNVFVVAGGQRSNQMTWRRDSGWQQHGVDCAFMKPQAV